MRDIVLSFDWETTSNQPSTTRGVQLAAIATYLGPDGSPRLEEVVMNVLCNPGVDITDGATEVHGITNEMVKDAIPDTEAARRLVDWILACPDRIILAGQNIGTFDIPILCRLAGVQKITLPFIDTLVCATRTLPDVATHKLGDLHVALNLGTAEGAHDALADIRMVNNLIRYFANGLKMTYEQLAAWCGTPRVLVRCHMGKHKGKLWGRAPAGSKNTHVPYFYAKWCTENWDDPSPDMIATMKHHYGLEFIKLKKAATA